MESQIQLLKSSIRKSEGQNSLLTYQLSKIRDDRSKPIPIQTNESIDVTRQAWIVHWKKFQSSLSCIETFNNDNQLNDILSTTDSNDSFDITLLTDITSMTLIGQNFLKSNNKNSEKVTNLEENEI